MYQTGTAATPTAVLQALANFAVSAGWTVDFNAAYTGVSWWLAVHKGVCFLHYVATSDDKNIVMYGATGYNASAGYGSQAGTSAAQTTNPGAGPYAGYHFFSSANDTYLHCLVETSTNVFLHLHGGILNTVGGASPGIYVSVSNWGANYPSYPDEPSNTKPFEGYCYGSSGSVLAVVDGNPRWFLFSAGATGYRCGGLGYTPYSNGMNRASMDRGANVFNGLAVMQPIPLFAERAVADQYSLLGEVPGIRTLNMKNNSAKDEYTIGGDTWKIFPVCANNPNINNQSYTSPSSYPYGLAFLKSA